MLALEFSQSTDFIFPILLIVFGVGTLAFQRILESTLEKYSLQNQRSQGASRGKAIKHFSLNAILERIAARRRISLSMTVVGVFWLLQSVF